MDNGRDAAKEGRSAFRFLLNRRNLRKAIIWLLILSAYFAGLSFYKRAMLGKLAQDASEILQLRHPKVLGLFQANFYFFYDEQFVPGIKQALQKPTTGQKIDRIRILTSTGGLLYDSKSGKPVQTLKPQGDPTILPFLTGAQPTVLTNGFGIDLIIPAGGYAILYSFEGASIRNRVLLGVAFGLLLGFLLKLFLKRERVFALRHAVQRFWAKYWRLRARFIFAIIVINLVTAAIVFFSLVSLQTREQTERIEKESILFSQFSTAEVISDFTNFFYFYYNDRFVPEMKRIIASNENLLAMRIISRRTGRVLFDSEQAALGGGGAVNPGAAGAGGISLARLADAPKAELAIEVEDQLKMRDLVTQNLERRNDRLLSVINTYRNENQEPLFWVEYLFNYNSLYRNIEAIRHQILLDLIPSTGLGLLLAILFAQFLISPIRHLVQALKRVSAGDYDVSVDLKNTDEIGDLVGAFNTMTAELKKKKELRKYLSDSTYRQIMAAPDSPEGLKLGGSRMSATVLFTDIRNFVGHCENLEAEEITAMLNEYFSEMVEVVYKHEGEVDKFIGDALLAVFYAEDEVKTIRRVENSGGVTSHMSGATTALQAIYCALEMRERLEQYNQRRRSLNKEVIEIGVGISHGEIISGPIGSKDRMDFTVIGDVVNIASRIEKLSKLGSHTKIVFSNHVEEKVRGLLDYQEITTDKLRGKEEEVQVYELIGIRDLRALLQNLKSNDIGLKRRSVELLGQSRNQEAMPYVLEALRDRDEHTQLNAVIAVGKLAPRDHPEAVDSLFRCIRSNTSVRVLSTVISTLGKVCTTNRLIDLAAFLEHPEERIVANAIEAIGQVRNEKATDLILPKLTSCNNRVKANAAMAVFAAGHIEVIDTLKPMLMHSDPLMRSSAAFAIGELTLIAAQEQLLEMLKADTRNVRVFMAELQECVPMLVSLLRDPDLMVKRQAVIALGKIKDKSAVLPIIEMIDPANLQQSKDLVRDVSQALRSIGSHSLVREVIARLS